MSKNKIKAKPRWIRRAIPRGKIIGIDARFYGPIGKGLGRYTKEMVDRVIRLDRVNKYVIFLSQDNFDEFRTDSPRVKKVLVKIRWYTLAEQIVMPWLIRQERIDLMHFPHFNVPLFCPTAFIVTIHDLILTKHPTQRASTLSLLFYKLKYFGYKVVIRSAIKKARKVIAVSDFTKNDIVRQFGVDEKKIVVTHEGIFRPPPGKGEDSEKINDEKMLLKYRVDEPYLLYVGNAYPHKNLEGLIKVFSAVFKKISNLSLILVGKDDYFYLRVKEFAREFNSNIVFPGFVPDKDLTIIYKHALAYIFPSFYEGFGLPPLEAMSHGCPVISSDKSSLPEVLGEAALYFNPDNEADMYKKIIQIIDDDQLRRDLIARGYEQVKKYSWDRCAEQTLAVYTAGHSVSSLP